MSDVLYLVHRIPYPPNKGDKIRSFHILEALAARYRVHLGTFVDAPEDREHVAALRERCASCYVAQIDPRLRRLLSLSGLLNGRPLTRSFYSHRGLASWCARTIAEHCIERAVVFSSSMAQFVPAGFAGRRVMDFCDIDSDKWRQYAARHRGPMRWIYGREAHLLAAEEARIAREFEASVFVSDREAETFGRSLPELAGRVHAIRNGVDARYFDPDRAHERPAALHAPYVVFTGAMDYWANVEGISWFVTQVWPRIRAERPEALCAVVGSRPTAEVLRLGEHAGVVVTGAVPDVRPYLRHAHAAIAPLRIARGVQNKLLEAMAMRRFTVAAPAAVQGLDRAPPADVVTAESAGDYAHHVLEALRPSVPRESAPNREYVRRHYDWDRNLAQLVALTEGEAARGREAVPA